MESEKTMKYIKECDIKSLWRKKDYHIDAMILTTFSPFGKGTLKFIDNELAAGSNDNVYSRVFLIGCNPVYREDLADENSKVKLLAKRIFCPDCGIICNECINNSQNNRKPQKYYHPKVWCIRFKNNNGNDLVWRIVVSSRNLADGAEYLLDGFFVTEGTISVKENSSKSHLVELLNKVRMNDTEIGAYSTIVKEIGKLQYSDKFDFYLDGALLKELQNADELYVLSPFANGAFIDEIRKKNNEINITVYGPMDEMGYLYKECQNKGVTNVTIKSHTGSTEDNEKDKLAYPLHAKQYIAKDKCNNYRMYIGSHNATANAFTNNTEFSVGFKIDEGEKDEIIKYWVGLYPDDIIEGTPRQQNETSDHFSEPFNEATQFDNAVSPAEETEHWNKMREECLNNACKAFCKELIGESDDDFDMLIRTSDKITGDITKAFKAAEDAFPAVKNDQSWVEYTKSCRCAYKILKGETK